MEQFSSSSRSAAAKRVVPLGTRLACKTSGDSPPADLQQGLKMSEPELGRHVHVGADHRGAVGDAPAHEVRRTFEHRRQPLAYHLLGLDPARPVGTRAMGHPRQPGEGLVQVCVAVHEGGKHEPTAAVEADQVWRGRVHALPHLHHDAVADQQPRRHAIAKLHVLQ